MPWLYLSIAIVAEVVGTSALKLSDGFTNLWPSLATAVSYAVAFYFLALTLKVFPVGIAYAIWSGAGIFVITLIGTFAFAQKLDLAAIVGLGLILAGVVVINTLSDTVAH